MSAKFNLNALNALIPAYQRASGKTMPVILAKFATKLSFALAKELGGITPEKGAIREEMLDALKNREHGIKLGNRTLLAMQNQYHAVGDVASRKMMFLIKRKGQSPKLSETRNVKGKELNYWALAAQKEIQYREAARFFTARGSRFGGGINPTDADAAALAGKLTGKGVTIFSQSRVNAHLGNVQMFSDGKTIKFSWGDDSRMSAMVATAMMKPRGAAAMQQAITQVVTDTLQYRRFEADFVKSFKEEWAHAN